MPVESFVAPVFTQLFMGKIKHFDSEMQMWGMSREVFFWLFLAKKGSLGQEMSKATLSVNMTGRKEFMRRYVKRSLVADL